MNSFLAVKVLFLAVGVSFAVVKVSVLALIGEVAPEKKAHNSLMNLTESVFMIGIIAVYLVFPYFYSDTDPDAWLNGFLVIAGLILFAIIFIAANDIKIATPSDFNLNKSVAEMKSLLKSRLVIVFAIFAFCYVMTEQGIMSWLPTFNNNVLHLSPKLSAQISVILMISIAFGRFLSSIVTKKINWLYIAVTCAVCAGIFILVILPMAQQKSTTEISNLSEVPLAGFLFPLIGLFLAPLYPLVNSTLLSNTNKNLQSSLAGIITFFSAIGGTTGSLLIGNLFEKIGGDKIFYLSLVPLFVMIFTFFYLNKLTKDEQN